MCPGKIGLVTPLARPENCFKICNQLNTWSLSLSYFCTTVTTISFYCRVVPEFISVKELELNRSAYSSPAHTVNQYNIRQKRPPQSTKVSLESYIPEIPNTMGTLRTNHKRNVLGESGLYEQKFWWGGWTWLQFLVQHVALPPHSSRVMG